MCAARLPWVVSALRVTYPHKKEIWFEQPFLKSAKAAAKYWSQVLKTRATIWERKAKEQLKSGSMGLTHSKIASLKDRISSAIEERKKAKIYQLSKSGRSVSRVVDSAYADTTTDTSDSDTEPSATSAEKAQSPQQNELLAPGPEKYSSYEIKSFKDMIKNIKDVDETTGHSLATAEFVDRHFSDNKGRAARVIKSPSSWKKKRTEKAFEMAAKILEDRCVS